MKAIKVSTHSTNGKSISTANQAIEYLKELGFIVNSMTAQKLNQAFDLFNKNEKVPAELRNFAMGNNSANPHVYLEDVSGKYSPKDIKRNSEEIIKIVTSKYPNLDLRLRNYTTDKYIRIEGGLEWYWNKFVGSNGDYCPIYEIFYKTENIDIQTGVEYIANKIEWALSKKKEI